MCYGLRPRLMLGAKPTRRVTKKKNQHTHFEAWWWQNYALGLVLFKWSSGFSQGGGTFQQFQISFLAQNLHL